MVFELWWIVPPCVVFLVSFCSVFLVGIIWTSSVLISHQYIRKHVLKKNNPFHSGRSEPFLLSMSRSGRTPNGLYSQSPGFSTTDYKGFYIGKIFFLVNIWILAFIVVMCIRGRNLFLFLSVWPNFFVFFLFLNKVALLSCLLRKYSIWLQYGLQSQLLIQ